MKFENNIYAETISIIRKMIFIVVSFTLGGSLFVILKELAPKTSITLFVPETFFWATLAYLAHRYVLLPDQAPFEKVGKQITQFFRRFLMLSVISILPAILVIIAFAKQLSGVIFFSSLVLSGIMTGLILSLYGTWLPASIMNDGTGLKLAGVRGRNYFLQTLVRLTLGPALISCLSLYLFAASVDYMGSDGLLSKAIIDLNIPAIVANILLLFAYCFATIITAVILSRAYLSATTAQT